MPILELQDWQGVGPANRVLKVVTLGDRRPDSMIPACSIHLITGAVKQLDLKVSRAVPWIILLAMSRTCCLKMVPGIWHTMQMLQLAVSDETSKLDLYNGSSKVRKSIFNHCMLSRARNHIISSRQRGIHDAVQKLFR